MKRAGMPSPAMVVALVALVLSVGGNVAAGVLIRSADIRDNTVRTVDVRNGSLTGVDVATNSLTGADVAESSFRTVPRAGKVDGFDANSLTRVARMVTDATLPLTEAFQRYGSPLSITAPRSGFVMIHGGITIFSEIGTPCTVGCDVRTIIRHVESGALSNSASDSTPPGLRYANISHALVFPVRAGRNTFEILIARGAGNGTLFGWFAELAAIYSPFGPTGTGRLGTVANATVSGAAPKDG